MAGIALRHLHKLNTVLVIDVNCIAACVVGRSVAFVCLSVYLSAL